MFQLVIFYFGIIAYFNKIRSKRITSSVNLTVHMVIVVRKDVNPIITVVMVDIFPSLIPSLSPDYQS